MITLSLLPLVTQLCCGYKGQLFLLGPPATSVPRWHLALAGAQEAPLEDLPLHATPTRGTLDGARGVGGQ